MNLYIKFEAYCSARKIYLSKSRWVLVPLIPFRLNQHEILIKKTNREAAYQNEPKKKIEGNCIFLCRDIALLTTYVLYIQNEWTH